MISTPSIGFRSAAGRSLTRVDERHPSRLPPAPFTLCVFPVPTSSPREGGRDGQCQAGHDIEQVVPAQEHGRDDNLGRKEGEHGPRIPEGHALSMAEAEDREEGGDD